MKYFLRTLKYLAVTALVLVVAVIGYIDSLTFTPYGRMDWRQAAYAKLFSVVLKPSPKDVLGLIKKEVDNIKPETILPMVASFQALKITADSLPVERLLWN